MMDTISSPLLVDNNNENIPESNCPNSGENEMAFRMRSSKFRHVYGSPAKKENCYECIKITKNAHDSNFCAVNPKFVAIVTESAGGGAFLVLPLEKVGRVDINASKVCGHSGPVLDIKWNPFNDNIIASCSDDATVKLWQIPEGGLPTNLTEWLVDLHGHQRRVGHLAWHPTAQSILLSAGFDHKCILWNTDTAEPINIINVHNDTIFSIAWNYDGSMFATTSKDKRIRIIDPREGEIIQEGPGHAGTKASKVIFLGENNRLFTTGFSRMSDRQYAVWDNKNIGRPLVMENIDSSSGVLFPYYDNDTRVVFIAGKGDGNIRYYELVNDPPYCHYLNQYQSSSPQRGLGIMPKRGIDPSRCEIVRFFKLHAVKGICEPVSMIVPRKSEMFQEDIFPPTASACPSLSADEWISGQDRQPILISLKDGALSSSPVITTYKAVKRGVGALTVTTPERGMKRQSTAPPTATVAPSQGRLPASLHNIRKMTSVDDSDRENLIEEIDNNENNNTVNDRITSYEKKTTVNVTKSLMRMTNNNQPLRVERKIWSTNYTGVNANVKSPTSNGMPRTDPERDTPFKTPNSTDISDTSNEVDPSFQSNQDQNASNALKQAEDELYASLQIEMPHQKTNLERKWSRVSDSGSDQFATPPTSPSPKNISPLQLVTSPTQKNNLNVTNDNIPIIESPASWNHNPIYKDSVDTNPMYKDSVDTKKDRRMPMQQREEKEKEISPTKSQSELEPRDSRPEPDDGIIRNSFYRRSLRSSNRSRKLGSDSNPAARNLSKSSHKPTGTSSKDLSEENNNKVPAEVDAEQDSAFIDIDGCFPADAPDHTLLKPSKLRASLRGRRRLTNGSTTSVESDIERKRQESTSSEPSEFHRSSRKSTQNKENQVQTDKENNQVTPSSHHSPSRNVIIVENKSRTRSSIASCTAKEKIDYPNPPIIPYVTINTEPKSLASKDLNNSFTDHPNANTPDALVKPSRVRDSFRKQRRHHTLDNSNSIHVKKVWSTSPETSPVSPPPDFGMIPTTDAELRKAYFRQVEEISSLKEQIGLKDKRIRQLEEEVRVLRDGRELMGESTC